MAGRTDIISLIGPDLTPELSRALREGLEAVSGRLMEGLSADDIRLGKAMRSASPDDELWNGNLEYFSNNETRFDGWLVHNSDYAQEIYEKGFNTGTTMKELAYSDRHTDNPGPYGFAYPIDKVEPPSRTGLAYCDYPDDGGSIVFVASGNHAFHSADKTTEVIFDWREPAGCYWVRNVRYDDWKNEDRSLDFVDAFEVVGRNENRPLFRGKYMDCIGWLRRNADTYSGQMKMWRNSHGRPTASIARALREGLEAVTGKHFPTIVCADMGMGITPFIEYAIAYASHAGTKDSMSSIS